MSELESRAFRARFEPRLYEELREVSKLRRSSINQFVIAAVRAHLRQVRGELIAEYSGTLEKLQEYRRRDPDFEHAMAAFVEAELAGEDPAEGRVVESVAPLSSAEERLDDIFED